MLLEAKDLNVYYGVIHAIKDVSFEVNEGEIVALIGSNGAGKTTIMHTISGLLRSKGGSIEFNGENITNMATHKIPRLGLIQVPEGRHVFTEMSVIENLEMGAYLRNDKDAIAADLETVFKRFPRLKERKQQLAGTLSGGEQQMLAMGRAMMARPKLLLLDEPSMGLSPIFVNEIFDIIQTINKEDHTTILIVEQNANKVLQIANRAYVLETGNITISGDANDVANNPKVKEAYLG